MPLNPPSYMCVVISIGLSVDYCAHVLYAFVLQPPGTRLERAVGAVNDMGASVVKGGFTTFLGVALLFLSPLEMFQFFVKPLTLAIGLGVIHGVVLVPVACVYLGPDPLPGAMKTPEGNSEKSRSEASSAETDSATAAADGADKEEDKEEQSEIELSLVEINGENAPPAPLRI